MRALLYCRVSDDRAEGRSVREQEAELTELCHREGWEVAHVITETMGASTYSRGKRTGWDEVRQIIGSGQVDILVTWENSRAARDMTGYADLRDLCAANGVQWAYSSRTHDLNNPDDRFTTGLDALLAEKEAGVISARVRRATRANAAAGRPHGRTLYGYQRVYRKDSGKLDRLEPDPITSAVVRRIYAASETGQGMDSIARDLNADGIPNPSGRPWAGLAVKRVLTNPGYAGRRVHRGEVVGPAAWPSLIEPDRFDRLQATIAARRVNRTPNRAWMLTGVTRCGVCTGRVGVKRSGRQPKYVCMERYCVARSTDALHDFASRLIVARLEMLDGLPADTPDDAEAAAVHDRITELEDRLDRYADQAAKGEVSVRMLVRIEKSINAELADLRTELRRLTVPTHLEAPTGDIGQWWDALTPHRRRDYIAALIDVIVIHRTVRGQRTFDPSRIEVVWR